MRLLYYFLLFTTQITGAHGLKLMDIIKSVIDSVTEDPPTSMPTNYPSLRATTEPPTSISEVKITELPAVNTVSKTKSPTSTPSKEPITLQTNSPTKVASTFPSSSPTEKPTSIPTNYPFLLPTSTPTLPPTLPPTLSQTNLPTLSPTMKPTNFPTGKPTDKPTTANPTIETHKCSQTMEKYQLKMFWEKGMEWQESKKEKAWCAECEDNCGNGDYVKIRECDDRDKDQEWLFSDCKVRPRRNPDVCFTAGDSKNLVGRIRLRPCSDDEDLRQQFRLYDSDDKREKFQFKILKSGYEDICLTQEHHPRDKEDLRFYDCRVAYKNDRGVYDDTSHWVIGAFDGHR